MTKITLLIQSNGIFIIIILNLMQIKICQTYIYIFILYIDFNELNKLINKWGPGGWDFLHSITFNYSYRL